ncbi:carbohydrate-binding protein [Limibacter armeniacum]|uniref:carbohydrate-binding protein n=1 Tax=Limibacter armeniacum TaxID=466084 RepID=UPI002FE69C31
MNYKNTLLLTLCLLYYASSYAQIGNVIWEDNFNTLNTDIWNVDVGDGCDQGLCGWGNAELQWYSENNVYVEEIPGEPGNYALVLEAKNEAAGGKSFTSGKVQSNSKLAMQYGLYEIRMRVPNLNNGLWPAAWMLGTSTIGWPGKGEIDVMEMGHSLAERTRQGHASASVNNFVGSNLIFAADAACSEANPSCAASTAYDVDYDKPYVSTTPLNDRFVTYRLYWTSTELRFTILDNGVEYDLYEAPFVIGEESTEFQQPFYLLMNLAVGGTFTDATANGQVTAPLPAKMYIDYIKISEYNGEGEVFFGNINPPETGTFGIFTDNTPTSNKLQAGVSSDIYAWGNLVEGTTAPYEGSEVIAWEFNAPNNWFGGGIVTRQARDMSNFEGGNLKFRIKIPADVSFRIGVTDNYTNQQYVEFPANQTKYGLVRNGEWGQATIPISDLQGGLIALQSMQYMFAIVSVDGAFPTSNFQLALDDIYWEGGGAEPDPVLTSISVTPATSSIDVNTTQQFNAQGYDQNGNPINASITWSADGGNINSAGLYTGTAVGTYNVAATSGSVIGTVAITVNNVGVTIPARLEAENYTDMFGVQLEATADTGGGQNVGWIEAGDWLEYQISVPTAGDYNVSYRVASETTGGSITLSANGVNKTTTSFTATGSWQTWATVSDVVNLSAGSNTIRLTADNAGWNLNWLEFSEISSGFSSQIEAEDYAVMSGMQTEACTEGGLNISYVDAGDWIVWDINLPSSGTYNVEYRVASPNDGGIIQLEQAGGSPVFGTVNVPNTGGWQNWTTISHNVSLNAGQQQIAISVPTGGWNLNWLSISSTSGARLSGVPMQSKDLGKVLLFPNPAESHLSIKGIEETMKASIFDLSGKVIIKDILVEPAGKVDVSNLQAGFYFIQLQGKTQQTLRFIKK